jgi:nucleoside-diphosphate-sugar epimerase
MVALVLGASGFIGRALVGKLICQKYEVRILSRKNYYDVKGADVYVGDLTDPKIDLDGFLDKADILFNCAGEISDESQMRELHVLGIERLIALARERVSLWVQISSVGAYGLLNEGTINEESPELPVGVYETTKTESDKLVKNSGINYVIIRPSNVFGLSMSNMSLFQLVEVVRKNFFFYIGKPGAIVNYVHVNDLVDSILLCSRSEIAFGEIFIVSQSTTVEKMIESFQYGLGLDYKPFRVSEKFIRAIVKVLSFLFKSFPLSESRVNALTGYCNYDSSKLEREMSFAFGSSLEKKFSHFSSKMVGEKNDSNN